MIVYPILFIITTLLEIALTLIPFIWKKTTVRLSFRLMRPHTIKELFKLSSSGIVDQGTSFIIESLIISLIASHFGTAAVTIYALCI